MEKIENKNYDLESLDVESVTKESKRRLNELEDDVIEQMNLNLDTPEDALEAILDEMNWRNEVSYLRAIDLKGVRSRNNKVTYNNLWRGSYEFVVQYQIDDWIWNWVNLRDNKVKYTLEYDARDNTFYDNGEELSDDEALDELVGIYSFVHAINSKKTVQWNWWGSSHHRR